MHKKGLAVAMEKRNVSRISHFFTGTFKGLTSLKVLNLHSNNLQILPRTTLGDLINLRELNMTNNGLNELTQDVFEEVSNLRVLSTDEYKFCCIAKQG